VVQDRQVLLALQEVPEAMVQQDQSEMLDLQDQLELKDSRDLLEDRGPMAVPVLPATQVLLVHLAQQAVLGNLVRLALPDLLDHLVIPARPVLKVCLVRREQQVVQDLRDRRACLGALECLACLDQLDPSVFLVPRVHRAQPVPQDQQVE